MTDPGNERQKVILRAKLNYMATEISDHLNVVNMVAADLAGKLCIDNLLTRFYDCLRTKKKLGF